MCSHLVLNLCWWDPSAPGLSPRGEGTLPTAVLGSGVCWEGSVLWDLLLCGGEQVRVLFLVLEDIDPDKVYVLGGLVDESIHKVGGACPIPSKDQSATAASPSLFPQILPGPSSKLGEAAAVRVP